MIRNQWESFVAHNSQVKRMWNGKLKEMKKVDEIFSNIYIYITRYFKLYHDYHHRKYIIDGAYDHRKISK